MVAGAAGGALGEVWARSRFGYVVWWLLILFVAASLLRRHLPARRRRPSSSDVQTAGFFMTPLWIALICPVAGLTEQKRLALAALVISAGVAFSDHGDKERALADKESERECVAYFGAQAHEADVP